MENNKQKLNGFTISDEIHLIPLVEKSYRKKFEIAKEFNIPPNTISSIIKEKNKILQFNNRSMKKIKV